MTARPEQNPQIEVIKYGADHAEKWRYRGRLLRSTASYVLLEAFFDRSDVRVGDLLLSKGDRFLEIYFRDRWYNIYEVYGGAGNIKGWYCNITRPARIESGCVGYDDLALDLVALPDGAQQVLDRDEFDALDLDVTTKKSAFAALAELQTHFYTRGPGFTVLNWPE